MTATSFIIFTAVIGIIWYAIGYRSGKNAKPKNK